MQRSKIDKGIERCSPIYPSSILQPMSRCKINLCLNIILEYISFIFKQFFYVIKMTFRLKDQNL